MSQRDRSASIPLDPQLHMASQQQQQPQETVMGPPAVPSTSIINPATGNVVATTNNPALVKPTSEELEEKYNKLKRKYQELEEKQQETALQLQRSGERNLKLKDERSALLDRIAELQADLNRGGPPHDQFGPPGTIGAYSRTMISARAQQAFEANLQEAVLESQHEDADTDPALTSYHIGPASRRRVEQELDASAGGGEMLTIIKETATKKTPVRKTRKSKEALAAAAAAGGASVSAPPKGRGDMDSAPAPSSGIHKLKLKLPPAPQTGSPADSSHPASPSAMAVDVPHHPTSGPADAGEPTDSQRLPPIHTFRHADIDQ